MTMYSRTQSQPEFPSLDQSHRSRSLDNRRFPAFDYSTLDRGAVGTATAGFGGRTASRSAIGSNYSYSRDGYLTSIPVKREDSQQRRHYYSSSALDQQNRQQNSMAAYEKTEEAQEAQESAGEEFVTFDRSVKYSHERKALPSHGGYSSEWSSNRQFGGGGASRYLDSAGAERRSDYDHYGTLGGRRRHEHYERQWREGRAAESGGQGAVQEMHQQQQYGDATAAAYDRGAAQRNLQQYQHYSHHRSHEASGGGGGAAAYKYQAGYTNGWGGGGSSYHHQASRHRAASAGAGTWSTGKKKGGWFSRGRKSKAAAGREREWRMSESYSYKQPKYYRFWCCCFPCVCPPWAYEPYEGGPVRPMYYRPPSGPVPRTIPIQNAHPPAAQTPLPPMTTGSNGIREPPPPQQPRY